MLSVKKCFLISCLTLLWGSFQPFPHALSLDTEEKGIGTSLSTSCPWKAAESNEVAPLPPFLLTKQNQGPQLLLTGHAFQSFHQLCCFPLDAFKNLHILLKLWGPELQTVLKVRSHKC